jgi:hypothetical protein
MHIKSGGTLLAGLFSAIIAPSLAVPAKRQLGDVDVLNDALVFDAPAFQDPSNPASLKAAVPAFVSLRPLGAVVDAFASFLSGQGISSVDASRNRLADRVQLFGAMGLPGKEVRLRLDGCNQPVRAFTSRLRKTHSVPWSRLRSGRRPGCRT